MKVNVSRPNNAIVSVKTNDNTISINNVNQTSNLRSKVATEDNRVVINEGGVQQINNSVREILQNLDVDIVPLSNNNIALGNSSLRFSDIYLSGNAIYLGNGTITSTNEGIIQLSGLDIDFGNIDLNLLRLTDVIDSGLVNNSVMVYDEDTQTFSFSLVDEDNISVSNTYILEKLLNVDGIGSNLDADKLDGYQSDYFLQANNLTFSNTVNLQGSGLTINSALLIESGTLLVPEVSTVVVDQFSINTLRTAKYNITISDLDDTSFYTCEILILHNDEETNITIYGEVTVGSIDVSPTITSDISGDYVRLIVSTNSNNQKVHIIRIGTAI